ncbi:hypothetical protein MRX96_051898 [Rhipicephalus microplus]
MLTAPRTLTSFLDRGAGGWPNRSDDVLLWRLLSAPRRSSLCCLHRDREEETCFSECCSLSRSVLKRFRVRKRRLRGRLSRASLDDESLLKRCGERRFCGYSSNRVARGRASTGTALVRLTFF